MRRVRWCGDTTLTERKDCFACKHWLGPACNKLALSNFIAQVWRQQGCKRLFAHAGSIAAAWLSMCTPSADAAEDGLHSGAAPCFPSPALAACSVHAWLPTFRRQALRCEVLHLPPDFLSYLTEDGLFVEPSSGAVGTFTHCYLQSNMLFHRS